MGLVHTGLLTYVARVRVTLCYAAIVTAVTVVMLRMDMDSHDALIRHASTNLHNLSHGRIGTLIGSAFVVDAGPIYLWLPGLVCLLAIAELFWGSARLLIAFALGHVGATLVVAAGLFAAVKLGWLPVAVARASDVGMSYGAMAVLGSLTMVIPLRYRPAWAGWWLAVAAVVVALGRDFTDIGHAVAMLLGMAVSTRFAVPARWTIPKAVLLAVAAMFGFLMLADDVVSMVLATGWGALGALLCQAFSRLRRPILVEKHV